jgi:hypothetical protein
MTEQPAPVSVYLTATGRSHVYVWPGEDRPDGVFFAGCQGCGWAAVPDVRDATEDAANGHAHNCHYLPREQWPEFLNEKR